MPVTPRPNSEGRKDKPSPTTPKQPPVSARGGDVLISDQEAAVIMAFETEKDEAKAKARATKDSGLSEQEVGLVHARAEHVRRRGYTLKSSRSVFKPIVDSEDTHAFLGNMRHGTGAEVSQKKDTGAAKVAPNAGS